MNEPPKIEGMDHGIWRRVKLVPWRHKFEGAGNRKRAEVVGEFLEERSGILNWLLDGLEDWRADGLQEPAAVLDETRHYKEESNHLQQWIDEECTINPETMCRAQELFEAYSDWCKRSRIPMPHTQTKFGREMENMGYRKEKATHGASEG